MAGISPRSLRDVPDIPRAADGTYSGQDIVKWAAGRIAPPELNDEEIERLLLVAERTHYADEEALDAVLSIIGALQQARGDGGLLLLFRLILDEWRWHAQAIKDLAANEEAHRKSAEFRQKYEAEKAARREARRELRIAVVCERCRTSVVGAIGQRPNRPRILSW